MGSRGIGKERGASLWGLRRRARITQESPPIFLLEASGDLENIKGGKKEVVRPKMVKKAKIELPSTRAPLGPRITDGLLASSPRSVKRGDFLDQLWTIQYKAPYFDLGDQPYEISLESGSPRALLLIPCPT